MNITDFVAECTALETELSDAGFITPDVTPYLRLSGAIATISADFKYSDLDTNPTRSPTFSAHTEDELPLLFQRLRDWFAEQPSPRQAREQAFIRNLDHLIQEGHRLDIPIVADLEATMKRLSTNILEHQQ